MEISLCLVPRIPHNYGGHDYNFKQYLVFHDFKTKANLYIGIFNVKFNELPKYLIMVESLRYFIHKVKPMLIRYCLPV